ncbi:hypothetical protein [Bacillus cereus]|uniref:hypothetical protein n=1 Tax=Bacillus cereus TaxID=1396 RepID=UPI000278D09C|nr:hypothetical protein [Bacillus cereus]EJQ21027.1 hypothetical protein IE9_05525 [Bacillus cereus BAG4X12-1]EOP77779.1 hypothetical protein IEG_05567 [Bacillus cereus BAG5X12-1]MEB9368840.1 hypothetical protein [Bacillus cereus]PES52450.1 hypothetical protein CN515_12325 [Bacillus cereus]PFC67944.1 hypothetical protein CN266_04550 [Bacillus cereus]
MGKNVLNDVLKPNIPVNIIQDEDIRIVVQNDNIQNEGWESNIKAIKSLLDSLPIGFIEKDTEDFSIRDKIVFLLLDSIGELLKGTGIGQVQNNNGNYLEEIRFFLQMIDDYKWETDLEFEAFLKRYK